MASLRVLIDGAPLGEGEARAFWKRFSDWMERHPSDLAGFAASESFASVHPEMQDGEAVLVASRSAPQRAYAPAPTGPGAKKRVGAAARPRRPKR